MSGRDLYLMPLFSRSRAKPAFTGQRRVANDRDRRALHSNLERGLAELARRAEVPGTTVLDLQLLLQVVGPVSYSRFRADREKAWRNQGVPYNTATWPATLEDGMLAVLLLPISAGRVGPAVGKHPRTVASPLFTSGSSVDGSRNDACLGVLTSWVSNPSGGSVTARLAPPVVEVFQGTRIVERMVETFGASWPLPAPDGL